MGFRAEPTPAAKTLSAAFAFGPKKPAWLTQFMEDTSRLLRASHGSARGKPLMLFRRESHCFGGDVAGLRLDRLLVHSEGAAMRDVPLGLRLHHLAAFRPAASVSI